MPRHTVKKIACYADDCDRIAAYSVGLCKMHYLRYKRYNRLHTVVDRECGFGVTAKGYIQICVDGKSKLEHIHLAELALGKPLPKGAQVHHVNKKPWDNHTPFNLVVCPDKEYHDLLHRRAKELGYEGD